MARRARTSKGRFVPATTKPRKPRKAGTKRRRKAGTKRRRSYKKNPPTLIVRETIGVGAAAIMGGLAAHAAVKVCDRIASPGVADVARVVIPALIGIVATQLDHKHAQAVAAGAFGVAGGALATSIADAIVRPNPPRAEDFWVDYQDNPPSADQLTHNVNRGYSDGVTALLTQR